MSEFGVDLTIDSVARHARREAFREAVEALREDAAIPGHPHRGLTHGAKLIESRFLSPDNPEGNA